MACKALTVIEANGSGTASTVPLLALLQRLRPLVSIQFDQLD
jgi:hypothetical protein